MVEFSASHLRLPAVFAFSSSSRGGKALDVKVIYNRGFIEGGLVRGFVRGGEESAIRWLNQTPTVG